MITSNIDNIGRVVIPDELMRELGLNPGSKIEIIKRNNSLIIRKIIDTADFIKKSDELRKIIQEQIDSPFEFEKLF